VCNELTKTSILLTRDGQLLATIGPKGVHHLPENQYMNKSEYRISVRHSSADHLNDVFAIRDNDDWRLKIESQRHANGVLEWKEASEFVICVWTIPRSHKNENTPNSGNDFSFLAHILS
jgi:hypothetical protein